MPDLTKFSEITESPSIRLADLARTLEAKGTRLIKLQTGDPDFHIHKDIKIAIESSIVANETHYSYSPGLPELRTQIAQSYSPKLTKDNVIVTHGAVHAIFLSLITIVRPGDHVLIPEPNWTTYDNAVKIAGGVPVKIDLRKIDFTLDIKSLDLAWTPQCTVLIINSPCNPSGKVISKKRLKEIIEWCFKKKILIIADEVYDIFSYSIAGESHCGIYDIVNIPDNIIVVNSFSKRYAMTGLRIGYLVAQYEVIKEVLKVQQATITNIAVPIQRGALVAMTSHAVNDYSKKMADTFKQRMIRVMAELDRLKLEYILPQGAFYFMVRIPGNCADDFCSRLLAEKGVVTIPGSAYGESTKDYLRIACCVPVDDSIRGVLAIGELIAEN